MVLAGPLRRRALSRPGAVALEHGGSAWPAGELDRWAGQVSAEMAARGVGPGAVVALVLADPVELLVGLAAADRLAATAAVVDAYAPAEVRAALLSRAGPALVLDSLPRSAAAARPPASPPVDDGSSRFLATCTSGSTGAPRMVVRSRRSWAASFAPFSALAGIGTASRVLVPGPLTASLSLFAAVHAVATGACAVLEPAGTAAPWTHVHGVPAAVADLVHGRPAAVEDLAGRTAVVGGAALPADLLAAACRRGLHVLCYYGAAELSFVAAGTRPDALYAFPWTELAVRDGVVWVRSPYLAEGYLGGGTGPYRRDADGWATVGDLGELDDLGRLRVRGRAGAALETGGTVVVAEEVEAALRGVPGVREVVVVPLPHQRLGTVPVAVLEIDPVSVGRAGLRAAAGRSLVPAWRPRSWWWLDRLPRTAAGKPDRAAVAAAAAGGDGGLRSLGARPLR